jgi:hypothetical protein
VTAWNEMSNLQKAASVLGGFFVAGTVVAVAISEYRPLPAQVRALSRMDSAFHSRIVRDSLRISDHAKTEQELRCLVLELFKPANQRRPQECQ